MSTIELSMGYLLHWGARVIRRLADRRLKGFGLSAAHLPIIYALAENEAMAQKALAAYASIEQPTMAATLTRMERDRIIERRPDPDDKRSSLFSLTTATRKKLPAIWRTIEDLNNEALGGLPESQRQQFRRQLNTMIEAMEARVAAEGGKTER
jgi:DNA-binding MarR family transcriptional regulator